VAEARIAIDENEVQAGVQPGQGFRAAHRIRRGRGGDHEAGLGEHALGMGKLNGFVDREG
jgi:hypothetical protein